MTRALVIAGAGVILYVNGIPFGRVSEFRFSSSTPRRATYGIDSIQPFELAPQTTKCTGTIKVYRTLGDAGAEGAGLTSRFEDISQEKYATLALIEKLSDTLIFQSNHCSITNQMWDVPSKGIITGTIEFEALDWYNELRSAKT